jgi:5-methyltetrahydrofolate--homocysteine methyltransferase
MSCRSLQAWLDERRLLTGDGGTGTLLQEAGLAPGGCPELWNVARPDAVRRVVRQYCDAGAELVETNSFGGSPHKLAAYGLADRCEELNQAGAALAREAAGDAALVVGSIGPTAVLLEPLGLLTQDEARAGFERQAQALAEGGVDVLCVETMIDIAEATCAVTAAAATGLPVIATMTFESTPRGFFTIMGVDIPTAAEKLTAAGASLLGTNCGTGPEPMVEIARAFHECSDLPILVQPNAGLPELRRGQVHYPLTPEGMASWVPALVEAGARVIGSCCGSTPEHVRAMSARVRELR